VIYGAKRSDLVVENRGVAVRGVGKLVPHTEGTAVTADPADMCQPFMGGLGIIGVSIGVLGPHGGQSTICSRDTVAALIDELQFELGEGPQWATPKTGTLTFVPDVPADRHAAWPMFGASMCTPDVGALIVFPLSMGMILVQLDVAANIVYSRRKAYGFSAGRTVHETALDLVTKRVSFRLLPK
jgi:hypothetical protein